MVLFLFESANHLSRFHAHLNTCYHNMSFLSFLDEEVPQQQGKVVTTVYRKLTFSCVYTHCDIFCEQYTNLV